MRQAPLLSSPSQPTCLAPPSPLALTLPALLLLQPQLTPLVVAGLLIVHYWLQPISSVLLLLPGLHVPSCCLLPLPRGNERQWAELTGQVPAPGSAEGAVTGDPLDPSRNPLVTPDPLFGKYGTIPNLSLPTDRPGSIVG